MDCTIITPSIGSYGGASKSAMDLILACSQNAKKTPDAENIADTENIVWRTNMN